MKPTTLMLMLLLPLGLSAQFTFETRVTNSPGKSYTSFNNANIRVANGDVVHLVYTGEPGLEGEVFYQRSIDGGISWQMAVQLTTDMEVFQVIRLLRSGIMTYMSPGQIGAAGMMISITENLPMGVLPGLRKHVSPMIRLIPVFLAYLRLVLWYILSGLTTVLMRRQFTIAILSMLARVGGIRCD